MKALYITFFMLCLAVVLFFVLNDQFASPAETTASEFVQAIAKGEIDSITPYFGDVTCSCPPKGGYKSYLKYDSGLDPNLAFLIGHPFRTGQISKTKLDEKFPYTTPWEKPVSFTVVIPLSFSPESYSPYLLPLPMAFGKKMSASAFEQFSENPGLEGVKGLSLRLRPRIDPGVVASHAPSAEAPDESSVSAPYLYPADAGPVSGQDGKPIPSPAIAARLPKLKSLTLKLKMERRGSLTPWLVSRFLLSDAIVQVGGREAVRLTDAGVEQKRQ